jgi:hypothetical protein
MKPIALFFTGTLISFFVFTNTSCKKETDCKAVIKCVDSTGTAVGSANVILFATVKNSAGTTYTADLNASGTADNNGEIDFLFKLPAIYDINATLVVDTKTMTGVGIIKLEEGKTVEKVVTMK